MPGTLVCDKCGTEEDSYVSDRVAGIAHLTNIRSDWTDSTMSRRRVLAVFRALADSEISVDLIVLPETICFTASESGVDRAIEVLQSLGLSQEEIGITRMCKVLW